MSETSIPVQPWMRASATAAVMAALDAAGGVSRFVGGCVRDAVRGEPVSDIDIATTLPPDRVTKALIAAGLKAVPTGIEHGTVTAVVRGRPFEVTTLRRDVETDGRHAVVAFTDDWAEDAARRDFRLNAIYADAEGRLYDPTGAGVDDARKGRVVFVGDPETRIREDALRILRFFRFYAWYGHSDPDPAGLAACARLANLIGTLSGERIAQELTKLLAADDPRSAMRLMAESGVLAKVLPESRGLERFDGLVEIETEQLFQCDAELRLAALLPDDPAAADALANRLKLSNALRARLAAALGTEPPIKSWMSPKEARRAVYRLGARAFCDRVLLAWAGSDRHAAATQWRALIPIAESWAIPALPLTGAEVMAAGVPEGPQVGEVMREIETWWIDQDFIDDKLSIVERLKAVVQGMVL